MHAYPYIAVILLLATAAIWIGLSHRITTLLIISAGAPTTTWWVP